MSEIATAVKLAAALQIYTRKALQKAAVHTNDVDRLLT
jgi:hypothetical protein